VAKRNQTWLSPMNVTFSEEIVELGEDGAPNGKAEAIETESQS